MKKNLYFKVQLTLEEVMLLKAIRNTSLLINRAWKERKQSFRKKLLERTLSCHTSHVGQNSLYKISRGKQC